MFGERIRPSPYKIAFGASSDACEVLCTKSYTASNTDDQKKVSLLRKGMFMNYQHHWIVDNMPVTWCYPVENGQHYCSPGFPMGCYVDKKGNPKDACVISRDYSTADSYYVFNHVDIVISYHDGKEEDWGKYLNGAKGGRIVSVKLTPVGGGSGQRYHAPLSSMAVDQRKHLSRFSVTKSAQSVGVQTDGGTFPAHIGFVPTQTNSGRVCFSDHDPAAQVHVMVPRQAGRGQGCSPPPVGPDHVSLPSCSTADEGSPEDTSGRHTSHPCVSSLANSSMVASSDEHVGGTIATSPSLPSSCLRGRRGPRSTIPRPSGGCSPFGEEYVLSHSSSNLDSADLIFISNHLASSTKTGYGYVFQKFRAFCETLHVDPITCAPAILVKYIRHLYDNGAGYSTVNHHRSSIAKFHVGHGGDSIGSHPLVSQAVKAVFRLRPPLPKYVATFDITKVFAYISSWPANENLTLKQLSYKTLFLLTSSTISRVSSITRLGPTIRIFEVGVHVFSKCILILCLGSLCA